MAEHEEQHTKSISFFNDRKVMALWNERNNKWWPSVMKLVEAFRRCNSQRYRVLVLC